jgi:hypothetical protein
MSFSLSWLHRDCCHDERARDCAASSHYSAALRDKQEREGGKRESRGKKGEKKGKEAPQRRRGRSGKESRSTQQKGAIFEA